MFTLLLADDEGFTRDGILSHIPFAQLGITTVLQAEDGLTALDIAKQQKPDILLTDVRMPGMDGIALGTEIRRLYPSCVIIFISGYSDKDYLKSAIKINAVDYVEKPIDLDELRLALQSAVQQCVHRNETSQSLHKVEDILSTSIPLLKSDLALKLIKSDAHIEPSTLQLCKLPNLFTYHITTLVIKVIPLQKDTPVSKEQLAAALDRCLAKQGMDAIYGFKNDEHLILHLYFQNRIQQKAIDAFCADFIQSTQAIAHLLVAVGTHVTGAKAVPASYQSAVLALEIAFYKTYGSVSYSTPPRQITSLFQICWMNLNVR